MKDKQHVEWCRYLFHSLKEGGVWGIPRSQVVFQKKNDSLVLISDNLDEDQEEEFWMVKKYFEAAGIGVVKKT